jgi:hypothetical protein
MVRRILWARDRERNSFLFLPPATVAGPGAARGAGAWVRHELNDMNSAGASSSPTMPRTFGTGTDKLRPATPSFRILRPTTTAQPGVNARVSILKCRSVWQRERPHAPKFWAADRVRASGVRHPLWRQSHIANGQGLADVCPGSAGAKRGRLSRRLSFLGCRRRHDQRRPVASSRPPASNHRHNEAATRSSKARRLLPLIRTCSRGSLPLLRVLWGHAHRRPVLVQPLASATDRVEPRHLRFSCEITTGVPPGSSAH